MLKQRVRKPKSKVARWVFKTYSFVEFFSSRRKRYASLELLPKQNGEGQSLISRREAARPVASQVFLFLIFWISLQENTKEVSAISPPNANDAGRDEQAQSEGCEVIWITRVLHFLIFLQDLLGDSSDYSDGAGRGLHRHKSTRERIGHARWTDFARFGENTIKFWFSHNLFSLFFSIRPRSTWDCSLEVCCTGLYCADLASHLPDRNNQDHKHVTVKINLCKLTAIFSIQFYYSYFAFFQISIKHCRWDFSAPTHPIFAHWTPGMDRPLSRWRVVEQRGRGSIPIPRPPSLESSGPCWKHVTGPGANERHSLGHEFGLWRLSE